MTKCKYDTDGDGNCGQPACQVCSDITPRHLNYHPNNIYFYNKNKEEMLRISPEGFYVREIKIEQGPQEAKIVYDAFIEWLRKNTNYRI